MRKTRRPIVNPIIAGQSGFRGRFELLAMPACMTCLGVVEKNGPSS